VGADILIPSAIEVRRRRIVGDALRAIMYFCNPPGDYPCYGLAQTVFGPVRVLCISGLGGFSRGAAGIETHGRASPAKTTLRRAAGCARISTLIPLYGRI